MGYAFCKFLLQREFNILQSVFQVGIRTDTKPAKVVDATVQVSSNKAVISWKAPAAGGEAVRGLEFMRRMTK